MVENDAFSRHCLISKQAI